jgi:predicted flavoprotein YhiN
VADELFQVTNKNYGIADKQYYQKKDYDAKFEQLWRKLQKEKLVKHSLEEIENYCNLHGFDGFLQGFLNPKIIHYLLTRFGGTPELIKIVKNLEFNFLELSGFDFSQVSVGGVDISEVNSSLESKKEKGVYFLGELLDIDGPCGGYNLTFAFASALKATK